MIKIAIVDDELPGYKTLQILLSKLGNEYEVVKVFDNPLKALMELPLLDIDILFLDIEMPHLNGFQLLKQLKETPFSVIFSTAYHQYAIEAFKYAAFDYLLKPIDKQALFESLERWKQAHVIPPEKDQIEYLNNIIDKTQKPDKLTIKTKTETIFLAINTILYAEADSNYTNFYMLGNKKVCSSKTLKEFESILLNEGFLRVHKSFVINPSFVAKIIKMQQYHLEMVNGNQIPVARSHQQFIHDLK
ncbi:MAG: LytTR family DNA-binding domain-containing protein [Chitinophagales bacterium]|nr:LytTR family DNA-binding domain-containing protein [Chitinophagales bacterium]